MNLLIKEGSYRPSLSLEISCSKVEFVETVSESMSNRICHPYHLVDISPWPLLSGVGALGLTSGFVIWFYTKEVLLFISRLILLLLVRFQWWRDVSRESTYQGLHTKIVETGIRWGIVLFIISEIIFFSSFFWAFFHRSLSPNVEIGSQWPPAGIQPFNPFSVPLLNTIILLSSGVRVTWSHHAIIIGNLEEAVQRLAWTVGLGVYFTFIQLLEYIEAPFTFSDSVYGRTFFIATGFHGLHVIVGTLFLLIIYIRLTRCRFSRTHHFGFEASAWYWHFVDVVWLFLFVWIYWWGGREYL